MVIVLKKGDNFKSALKKRLKDKEITSAFLYGVGGFLRAELAVFDSDKKEYISTTFEGNQLEVLSLTGDISLSPGGEVLIHCHTVLSGRDYNAIGGHLVEATVGATCELNIEPLDYQLTRMFNKEAGINVINNK